MIDTHTHLYMADYGLENQAPEAMDGQCAVVDRAVESGVSRMILPNVDLDSVEPIFRLHQLRPEATAVAMGLHPTEVKENWQQVLESILNTTAQRRGEICAIGEAGIDLYWDKTFLDAQMQAFDRQAAFAVKENLPLIIHCRDGLDQALEVLQAHKGVRAVFHSFGGTPQDVERIRRVGDFYFGINGIVTFKNSKLAATLPAIGMERLVTETDAPFLAPTPHRGKRNESAYIPLILGTMADAMDVNVRVMDEATTRNAQQLFNI